MAADKTIEQRVKDIIVDQLGVNARSGHAGSQVY